MKKGVILATVVASLISCSKPKIEDLSSYYFPFGELNSGKEYIYEVKTNNEVSSFTIRLKSEIAGNKKYLYTQNFVNNNLVSDSKEIVHSDNSVLLNGRFYEPANNGSPIAMKSKIDEKENIVFSFNTSKGEGYSLQVSNQSNLNNTTINYRRKREFAGFSQISFQGKKINCIIIKCKEQFTYPTSELTLDVKEYFGQGIGLIKTEKKAPGLVIETTLKQILPLNEQYPYSFN
ncbi:MAG: hypothetical protein IPM71_02270 [Bacteroidota bacterium]|nr:MAG: hypothetical protein IPM71_02270 [Bacteroidota bacterium]